jgi:hypothetical protein
VKYLVALLFLSSTAFADCSREAVQAAVNAAVDGQTVTIPAGNCTWDSPVTWSDKNITVQGDGTVINVVSKAFHVKPTTKPFRISSLTITGNLVSGASVITIDSLHTTNVIRGWRIDHIHFDFPNQSNSRAIVIWGLSFGLVDHNVFDGGSFAGICSYAQTLHDWKDNGQIMGTDAHATPTDLGGADAVFIEDNVFNYVPSGIPFVNDMTYGGRQVFRYNVVNGGIFQSHSSRDRNRGGAIQFEVYNNVFNGKGYYRPFHLRSGTGVIFNNTISGYVRNEIHVDNQRSSTDAGCSNTNLPLGACNGTNPVDGNVEPNGWPCLDQIGRGNGPPGQQPSEPLHAWNNGGVGIVINPACKSAAAFIKSTPHANGEVDYVDGPKPCYKPYVYPHPLNK